MSIGNADIQAKEKKAPISPISTHPLTIKNTYARPLFLFNFMMSHAFFLLPSGIET